MRINAAPRPIQRNHRFSEGFIQTIAELKKLPRFRLPDGTTATDSDIMHELARMAAQMMLPAEYAHLINSI